MSEFDENNGNFASLVLRHAHSNPERMAIVVPKVWDATGVAECEEVSYGELAARIASLRAGFAHHGLKAGDRVVVARCRSSETGDLKPGLVITGKP